MTMQIKSKIHNTKKDGRSIDEYYFKIKALVEDLRCVGNLVSEDEQMMFLIEGLGSEYDLVMVNITLKERKLPLSEVYLML